MLLHHSKSPMDALNFNFFGVVKFVMVLCVIRILLHHVYNAIRLTVILTHCQGCHQCIVDVSVQLNWKLICDLVSHISLFIIIWMRDNRFMILIMMKTSHLAVFQPNLHLYFKTYNIITETTRAWLKDKTMIIYTCGMCDIFSLLGAFFDFAHLLWYN